jgi:hypothetical protein
LATYEFISLKCISQNELGGDEIFVEYVGAQVFPEGGLQAQFKAGRTVVNLEAQLDAAVRSVHLDVPDAHPVTPYEGVESFLNFSVPDHGLVVEVWEHDVVTSNDLMGRLVIFQTPTKGPVTKRLDKAFTGVYELTYQVY